MLKSAVIAATIFAATTTANACDPSSAAGLYRFYDKACTKLPSDFLTAVNKAAAGMDADVKDALASEQASYDAAPKEYCSNNAKNVAMAIAYYRKHKGASCL
jgi:hypothetical protein